MKKYYVIPIFIIFICSYSFAQNSEIMNLKKDLNNLKALYSEIQKNKYSKEMSSKVEQIKNNILSQKSNEEILLSEFDESKDIQEKIIIINLLSDFKGKNTIHKFHKALNEEKDKDIITYLLISLGKIKDVESIKYVANKLESKDKNIELLTIRTLGKFKDKKSNEEIIEHFKKSNDFVIRNDCLRALYKSDDKEVKILCIESLADKSPDIRSSAIRVLSCFNDEKTIDIIGDMLLKDEHPMVRMSAVYSLGEMNNIYAKKYLVQSLKDDFPDVRKFSEKALKKLDLNK